MVKHYYVKYSLDGRRVVKSAIHINSKYTLYTLEKYLDCDDFVSGSIAWHFEYQIKPKVFKLPHSKVAKISFISWRFTRYPDDIKAASHHKMQRVLAFKIVKKNLKKAI